MSDKQHPSRELLAAFLAGTLPDSAHEGIAGHVAECDACCAQLRQVPEDPFVARLRGSECGDPVPAISEDDTLPRELREHPKYKIGRYLGAGGMGLVYQAEHRLMDRVVALKIIHRDLSRQPRVVQRFRQEVRAAGKLSHPNIVAAYDAEQAGDAHFLVMEFVDGMSLDRLISKRGQLEPAYAAYFIRQAAKGLQHAFEKGMVHRDIKPQNLMLTRKGQIKILDFGLARLASETRLDLKPVADVDANNPELTKLGEIMGTPDYMAPEQATDSSQADIRADIYSLGCTLYYLLAGQPPFEGETARDKVYAQRYEEPTPIITRRSDVSVELAAVLEKMMAKDPDERHQTPADVVKALAPFARPTPVSVPAPEPKKTPIPAPEAATPRAEPGVFQARCPFCLARIRIPVRGLGASLPCPHCNSFFTAVPEDETPQRG